MESSFSTVRRRFLIPRCLFRTETGDRRMCRINPGQMLYMRSSCCLTLLVLKLQTSPFFKAVISVRTYDYVIDQGDAQ